MSKKLSPNKLCQIHLSSRSLHPARGAEVDSRYRWRFARSHLSSAPLLTQEDLYLIQFNFRCSLFFSRSSKCQSKDLTEEEKRDAQNQTPIEPPSSASNFCLDATIILVIPPHSNPHFLWLFGLWFDISSVSSPFCFTLFLGFSVSMNHLSFYWLERIIHGVSILKV